MNWNRGLIGVPTVTGCLCAQDSWTALISAAKEGHIEVVKELLENNANLEHRDMVRMKENGTFVCGYTSFWEYCDTQIGRIES